MLASILIGMGIGLYNTALAALGRIYGSDARSTITGITLLAGFASTVGWPLTAWGAGELGWGETCPRLGRRTHSFGASRSTYSSSQCWASKV
jgi:hypothetical protein